MTSDIPVLVRRSAAGADSKGLFGAAADVVLENIPVEKLRSGLTSLCHSLGETLDGVGEVGQFELVEVTVQVEVQAGGKVSLVGVGGGEVGGSGALTLKFAKPKP